MANELKAIYFDDDSKHLEGYGDVWSNVLKRISEEVELDRRLKMDEVQICKKLPHIVIVDNVIRAEDGSEIDNEGASFISRMKKKFPHIIFVLFTQQTFSVKTLAQLFPNPDLIVPKITFRSEEYQENWIVPRIKEILLRRPAGKVLLDDMVLHREYKEITSSIECILEQSLNDVVKYEPSSIEEIKLKKLTGGASGASVFVANIAGLQRLRNVPVVFRLAEDKDIRREISNYKKYVTLQVPHNVRVELLGSGFNCGHGGAVYAFALGDVENTTTALKYLDAPKPESQKRLTSICGDLFNSDQGGWYIYDIEMEIEIVEYFSNSEEYAPSKDNRRISGIQKNLFKESLNDCQINNDYIVFNNTQLQLPRNLIDRYEGSNFKQCICHGDLNLNNVIVSDDGRKVALIDFEYCGFDHLFKDFISLEVSLLELGDESTDISSIYEKKVKGFEGLDLAETNFELQSIVRNAFFRKFADQELEAVNEQYLICLAFHLFKVAALPGLDSKFFQNMFATLCAIMKVLEDKLNGAS